MAKLTNNQIKNLAYVPFPKGVDFESYSDYDGAMGGGFDAIVYPKGIIVNRSNLKEAEEMMDEIAEFFNDEE